MHDPQLKDIKEQLDLVYGFAVFTYRPLDNLLQYLTSLNIKKGGYFIINYGDVQQIWL